MFFIGSILILWGDIVTVIITIVNGNILPLFIKLPITSQLTKMKQIGTKPCETLYDYLIATNLQYII